MTLSYAGVIMLIAAILGALVSTDVPGRIGDGTEWAVCLVVQRAGCELAERPSNPNEPGDSNDPNDPNGPPSIPPSIPPQAVDPYEPQQDCWTWVRDATVEGTLNVPLRVLTLRGQHRVVVTTRRVQHPDGTISYDVIVSPNVEAGVATPKANSGQMGASNAEGGSAKDKRFNAAAWVALQATKGKIYSFHAADNGGDEAKTREDAQKFADKLWLAQAQGDAAIAVVASTPGLAVVAKPVSKAVRGALGWLTEKTAPVTKHLPVVGDNIERAIDAPKRDLDRPNQDFFEAGPTAGFDGSLQVWPGKVGISFSGRGFINGGMRVNHDSPKYNKNYYFKMNGEGEVAPTLDLGFPIPKNTSKSPQAFEKWIKSIEDELGHGAKVPEKIKKVLQADWPDIAFSVKGKGARMFMLTTDDKNNPTQLRTITETQYLFSVQGKDTSKRKGKELTLFGQTSTEGRKYLTQSILDLDGPENAENLAKTKKFLAGTGTDLIVKPYEGLSDYFGQGPEARIFDEYLKRNGQTYQQYWDSDVTTMLAAGDVGVAGGYLLYEPETNTMAGAQYYNPDKGWLPWNTCKGNK